MGCDAKPRLRIRPQDFTVPDRNIGVLRRIAMCEERGLISSKQASEMRADISLGLYVECFVERGEYGGEVVTAFTSGRA